MPAEVRKIDPTVDCVFKRLLGSEQHKALTISFLNAVLELEGDNRIVDTITINPHLEKNHRGEKVPVVDIMVRDESNNTYQIEIQKWLDRFFEPRVFYGWTKVNAGLLEAGQSYGSLKRGISIWLLSECMFKPSQTRAASLRFRLHCPEEGLDLWPGSYVVILQLPNFEEEAKMGSDKAMWLRFFREAKDADPNRPPSWLQHPTLQEALKVLQEFANDVNAYLGYVRLEKAQREQWLRTTYLDQTIAELSATQTELSSTQNKLSSTQNKLSSTQTELSSTQTELSSTQTELSSTQTELSSTKSELSDVKARLNQSETENSMNRAQLAAALMKIEDLTRRVSAIETKGTPPDDSDL